MPRLTSAEAAALGILPPDDSAGRAKKSKYGVADKAERTLGPRTYASRLERDYAEMAYRLLNGSGGGMDAEYAEVVEQPIVVLGPDTSYRPDFLVIPSDGRMPRFVDTKGFETPDFRRIARLWAQYARLPLEVVRRYGSRFAIDRTIWPRGMASDPRDENT